MATSDQEDILQNIVLTGEAEVIAGFAAIAAAGKAAFDAIATGTTSSGLDAITTSIGGFTTAVAAATAGLFAWSQATSNSVFTMGTLAAQAGFTTEQFTEFSGVLQSVGASTDHITQAFRQLAYRVTDDWAVIQKSVREAALTIAQDNLNIAKAQEAIIVANTNLQDSYIKLANISREQALARQKDTLTVQEALTNLKLQEANATFFQQEQTHKRTELQQSVAEGELKLRELYYQRDLLAGNRRDPQLEALFKRQELEQQIAKAEEDQAEKQRQVAEESARREAEAEAQRQAQLEARLRLAEAEQRLQETLQNQAIARQKAEEEAANRALQAQETQLRLQEAQRKAAEDYANDIRNLIKYVDDLASGVNVTSANINASAQNIFKGIIASTKQADDALKGFGDSLAAFGEFPPSLQEVMLKTADVMHNMRSETERTALAVTEFGRGVSPYFVQALSQGSQYILNMEAHFKSLGFTIDDTQRKIAFDFVAAFGQLNFEIRTLGQQLSSLFTPAFTAILDTIREKVEENRQAIVDWGKSIADAVIPFVAALVQELSGLDVTGKLNLSPEQLKAVDQWRESIRVFLDFLRGAFEQVKIFFYQDLPGAIKAVRAALEEVAEVINRLFGTKITGDQLGLLLLAGQVTGVNNTVVSLISSMTQLANIDLGKVVFWLGAIAAAAVIINWPSIVQAAQNAWDAVAKGASYLADQLTTLFGTFWTNFVAWASRGSENAAAVVSSAWSSISSIIAFDIAALSQAWEDVKKAASFAWAAIVQNASDVFSRLPTVVQNALIGVYSVLSSFLGRVRDDIIDSFEQTAGAIAKIVDAIVGGVSKIKGALGSVFTPGQSLPGLSTLPQAPGLAGGGTVGGQEGVDKNLAYLTKGEFVIQKQAVDKYGPGILNAINNMSANLPRFSLGGIFNPRVTPTESQREHGYTRVTTSVRSPHIKGYADGGLFGDAENQGATGGPGGGNSYFGFSGLGGSSSFFGESTSFSPAIAAIGGLLPGLVDSFRGLISGPGAFGGIAGMVGSPINARIPRFAGGGSVVFPGGPSSSGGGSSGRPIVFQFGDTKIRGNLSAPDQTMRALEKAAADHFAAQTSSRAPQHQS